jgi:hypothetical protein
MVKWVGLMLLIIAVPASIIFHCTPGGLAPEHVYKSYALHYMGPLKGSTGGPILPPVSVIEIYRLQVDQKWPRISDFDHLPKVYETTGPDEIQRILATFKERPKDYLVSSSLPEKLALLIKFETGEQLAVPMALCKEAVSLYSASYCREPSFTESVEMMNFLLEKGLVDEKALEQLKGYRLSQY